MRYQTLANTDLNISKLCLGTMTWGEQNTEQQAHQQLDYALDQGINFIDTAEMYPVPPQGDTQGTTECHIGSWFKSRNNRDKVILATKVAGPGDWLGYLRGGPRLNREHIQQAVDASLKRLQTDYIDLYQLHWPDRHTNYFGQLSYSHNKEEVATPLLETLEALNEQVKAGKIRHVGVSNETPWGVMKYLQLAEAHNLPRMVSIQNPYSLLNRTFEIGLAEIAHRENIPLLAYSPLGFGVLSGKYLGGAWPEHARLTLYKRFQRYTSEKADIATQAYVDLAREHQLDPAQMALAFVNERSFMASNIIGATTMEQLASNIASIELTLSDEVIAGIEAIHQQMPNPCP
ncbi:NADP(H)-dependent aldo-keto reductase [Oceanospirillum beijerinckii]|uniref:NADP(H)-dependent aldo-keto reductase n=1 Tax=Oceanospirillum beijerinckii TaxID=64976 RepID=UPI00040E944B|nr:NADP(H)-dependent aldo-keto reductase [Oceanospirillum beijerinckii]MAC47238.1 NADP(H)-dependent aldo-keto reductase [Oceanospirillum sp.]